MSESEKYIKMMISGDSMGCYQLEQSHDLDGYTPEMVSIGLRALDAGLDPHGAIDDYLSAINEEVCE